MEKCDTISQVMEMKYKFSTEQYEEIKGFRNEVVLWKRWLTVFVILLALLSSKAIFNITSRV